MTLIKQVAVAGLLFAMPLLVLAAVILPFFGQWLVAACCLALAAATDKLLRLADPGAFPKE